MDRENEVNGLLKQRGLIRIAEGVLIAIIVILIAWYAVVYVLSAFKDVSDKEFAQFVVRWMVGFLAALWGIYGSIQRIKFLDENLNKDFTIRRRRSMSHHPVQRNEWCYDVVYQGKEVVYTAGTEKEARLWIRERLAAMKGWEENGCS